MPAPAGGGEDLDVFVRTILAGHAIAYEPAAIGWHEHRDELGQLRRQLFNYGVGLAAFATKYLSDPRTARDILVRLLGGLRHLRGIAKRVERPAELPRTVLTAELLGLAWGRWPTAWGASGTVAVTLAGWPSRERHRPGQERLESEDPLSRSPIRAGVDRAASLAADRPGPLPVRLRRAVVVLRQPDSVGTSTTTACCQSFRSASSRRWLLAPALPPCALPDLARRCSPAMRSR